ncbi:MAG: ABC transporter permease [Anaerolineae bacterium]|nr:ABC transporter permease [Anaerolineae bacterium]MCO5208027.1 ABC transporter permease [Anaerolineae bacterium]
MTSSTNSSSNGVMTTRESVTDFFKRWEWLLVALIVIVALVNVRLTPYFLDTRNLMRATSDFMELGLMMLPMVFIIVTGNIDLSVASTMAMCASLLGLLHMNGTNIWVAVVAALVLGLLAGLLNGYLVAKVKLPSLVVTLGTFAFYRGMAFAFLGDQAARGYPEAFTYLGQGTLGSIRFPFSAVLFIFFAIIFTLILHKMKFGRTLYVIGNNEDAGYFAGVNVDRTKIVIFMMSGFMSALAGIVLAARFGSTRPDIGTGLELAVITAVVLGGVSIMGGSGTMIGAILALVLIGEMRFGMGLINIPGQGQNIVIGFMLILSIMLPYIARQLTGGAFKSDRNTWGKVALGLIASALFALFFFWSRNLLLGAA